MKKFIVETISAILLFLPFTIHAQIPSYEARLMNDYLISASSYEFEIYIKNTGTVPFETYGIQVSLIFNDTIRNRGELSAIFIPGTSEMLVNQVPDNPIVSTVVGDKRVFQLAAKIASGPGAGTIISSEGDGTRLGRFRILTTAKSFSNAKAGFEWNFDQANYNYATKVHAYVDGLPKDITLPAIHLKTFQADSLAWWLNSEMPSYEAKILNDIQTSPNEFEFDIFVKHTNSLPFEVFGLQVCLLIDDTISNGGTLSGIYISGTSQMDSGQVPNDPNLVSKVKGKRVFKLAGKIPSGPGNGTKILNEGYGTRLGRFRIATTAEKFADFPPNISWNFDQSQFGYATKFYVYSPTAENEQRGRDVTEMFNHFLELKNLPLNFK